MRDPSPKNSPGQPRFTIAVAKLKVIWNDKNIAISSKVRLMRYLVMSTLIFVCMWNADHNSRH